MASEAPREREDQVAPYSPKVKAIQEKLSIMGFYSMRVDGLKGPGTNQAIVAYKNQNGLKPADSSINAALLSALGISEQRIKSSKKPRSKPKALQHDGEIVDISDLQ